MTPELLTLPLGGPVPNNTLPARLYRAALKSQAPAQIEQHLAERGWTNAWRNGIYPFHHYHSTAHEVLVIARGQARLTLGGEGGPQVQVGEGDVLLLPAGTGHRNDGSSADLLVIGAYAGGRDWDLCRPEETDVEEARERIGRVPGWEKEPVGRVE
ncbi:twin-arginine translocation pathway signal [Deinococcus aerius]|uniref:Twin-arginine translocation pathway signal n=1 Tax=Deinococcus aerius TaxID=200253 RepID=A0A2I9CTP9_9DEIO|nr:cupin domain-containing protein [Deinococcus aerius]GBF05169.1 twin-arginine translocation pathway signal [Deinococcus aerius]